MQWPQHLQPVLLHALVVMVNCQHVDARVAHDHVNCTAIGHGAVAVMILNSDTSKFFSFFYYFSSYFIMAKHFESIL